MLPPNLQSLADTLRAMPVRTDEQHGLLAELQALADTGATLGDPALPRAEATRSLMAPAPADPNAPPLGNMTVQGTADGDIAMTPLGDVGPTEDQQLLVLLVERTLIALKIIYQGRGEAWRQRYDALLSLAQAGLAGAHPTPGLARRMLEQMRGEIVEREAGRLKQAHMLELGRVCFRFGAVALGVGGLGLLAGAPGEGTMGKVVPMVGTLGVLLASCAAGVWVSFAARKGTYTFEDLTVPERDYLSPFFRIVFAFILTTVLALMFDSGAAAVSLGSVSTQGVLQHPLIAIIVGFLCGFSEQVLAQAVQKQASGLLKVS